MSTRAAAARRPCATQSQRPAQRRSEPTGCSRSRACTACRSESARLSTPRGPRPAWWSRPAATAPSTRWRRRCCGSGCALGVLPKGTFNYFSRTHAIPTDTGEALRAAARRPAGAGAGRPGQRAGLPRQCQPRALCARAGGPGGLQVPLWPQPVGGALVGRGDRDAPPSGMGPAHPMARRGAPGAHPDALRRQQRAAAAAGRHAAARGGGARRAHGHRIAPRRAGSRCSR